MKALSEKAWLDVRVKREESLNNARNPESKDEIIAGLERVLKKQIINKLRSTCRLRNFEGGWR